MQYQYTPNEPLPKVSGIYRITCTSTGKFYIGSAVNLRNRLYEHRKHLKGKTHKNPKLQCAWNKYGPDAFFFEVLELVLVPELLTAREQSWFNKLKPFGKRGFNIDPIAGSQLGAKRSPESLERMRLARLGTKMSDEAKRNMAHAQTGRKHSPETIEKMRNSALQRPPRSQETCAKISAGHIGKPAHNRGKKLSPDGRYV